MNDQPIPTWRIGDQAKSAGERVTVRGFIDPGTGPLDEVVVELANGDERTVHRERLVLTPDFSRERGDSRGPPRPRAPRPRGLPGGGPTLPQRLQLGLRRAPDPRSSRSPSCCR